MAALTQKTAFADDFTTLADKPNKTAAEMKALFESQPGELLTYINDTQIKEITEGTYNFAASAVGTDAYAVTIANVAALTAGLELFVLADVANTGAATCQVNALTAKAIRKNGVVVLEDGDIPAGGVAHLKYDGTNFQLLNPIKTTALTAHLADYASKFPDNAGAHNSIYRGKSLGTSVTTKQYADIANGTFEDMYIGDYWTINSRVYRIAAFNYYMQKGDTATTANHITLVPDVSLYVHVMNDTNITTGGYIGSKMYTEGLNNAKTTIKSDFSGHVLNHRKLLSNAVTDGKASGWVWANSEVDLMNEVMLYGSIVWGESAIGGSGYNVGEGTSQLPLFALKPDIISNRQTFWLRDVVSAAGFAYVNSSGYAANSSASYAPGVRPAFSIS